MSNPDQTGQTALLYSHDLLCSQPVAAFPEPSSPVLQGSRWRVGVGKQRRRRTAWNLDIRANYHNKNIILTSW